MLIDTYCYGAVDADADDDDDADDADDADDGDDDDDGENNYYFYNYSTNIFNKNGRFKVCGAAKAPAVKLQFLDSLTLNNVICNLRLPLRRLMISLYCQRVGSS